MSDDDARRERIKSRIAASQARLDRNAPAPARRSLPDASPPEDYRSLALEYPWLTLAAALGGGMLIGALLPRGIGRKLGRSAMSAAMAGSELAIELGRHAGRLAEEGGREGLSRLTQMSETISESGSELSQRAARASSDAAASLRTAGASTMRKAIGLASRARR